MDETSLQIKWHTLKEWTNASGVLEKIYLVFTKINNFNYILLKLPVPNTTATQKENYG